ncbi:archaeosortase A [Salinarchaeum chitinilyticum]
MVSVVGLLEALGGYSTPLIWLSILAFVAGAVLEVTDRRSLAVPIAAGGWVLFGVYWFSMFHYFYVEFGSPLEGVLSLAALPLSLYAAYLLLDGRDSLLVVSRAIACMGLIYLPIATIEPVKVFLIESVAQQSAWGMELLGYDVTLTEGSNGYQSRFTFASRPEDSYTTYIVLACTGIGSISIFGGLTAAVQAPLRRKLGGFLAATGIIYVLNLFRNVFVGLAAPFGWFGGPHFQTIASTLGGGDVHTSFFVSHHLISQSLSVVALIAITLIVIRIVPEVVEPLEEVLYVLTNTEVDLRAAIGEPSTTAGGVDVSSGGDASSGAGDGGGSPPGEASDDLQPDGGSSDDAGRDASRNASADDDA